MASQSSGYRSSTYHIVIEEYDKENDRHITERDLSKYLESEMRIAFYSFIKHDSDVNEEGAKERVHYHVIIVLNSGYAKSTIISAFANGLTCNIACVSVRKIKSFVKAVQYLLHKNNKDKFQYEYLDIWTNDVNELNLCLYENSSSYELDINYLYELCKCADCIADIYKALGIKKSRTYRSLIMDMYKEEHFDKFL